MGGAVNRGPTSRIEKPENYGNGFVNRGGRHVGSLVGPKADIIKYFDRLEGLALDTAWAERVRVGRSRSAEMTQG